ncbi:hypothetical protein ACC758_38520, partial [Rhizobium ruizarguesonis]
IRKIPLKKANRSAAQIEGMETKKPGSVAGLSLTRIAPTRIMLRLRRRRRLPDVFAACLIASR